MTPDIFYDEKGKIFTSKVTKKAVEVVIQTLTHRIEGCVHVRPEDRLTDQINQAESFLPITQATILTVRGEILYETQFLTVNREHIIWLFPKDEAPALSQDRGKPS